VLDLALLQRRPPVRARGGERHDLTAVADHHYRLVEALGTERALRHVELLAHRGPVRRLGVERGVRDPDPPRVHEVATEIPGARGDGGADRTESDAARVVTAVARPP